MNLKRRRNNGCLSKRISPKNSTKPIKWLPLTKKMTIQTNLFVFLRKTNLKRNNRVWKTWTRLTNQEPLPLVPTHIYTHNKSRDLIYSRLFGQNLCQMMKKESKCINNQIRFKVCLTTFRLQFGRVLWSMLLKRPLK